MSLYSNDKAKFYKPIQLLIFMNDIREHNHQVDNLLARREATPKSNMLSNILLATGVTIASVAGLMSLFSVDNDFKKNDKEASRINIEYSLGWRLKQYDMVNDSIAKAKELCSRTSSHPEEMNISEDNYNFIKCISKEKPVNTRTETYY